MLGSHISSSTVRRHLLKSDRKIPKNSPYSKNEEKIRMGKKHKSWTVEDWKK